MVDGDIAGLPDGPNRNQSAGDFLELDFPERRHRTFGRLGLLFLGAGAALLLVSSLLTITVAQGNVLDLLVVILWLGGGLLGIVGLGLVGLAGISALTRTRGPVPDR
jgi:hypothetical protein